MNGLIIQWGDYTNNATTNDVIFSVIFSQSNPAITCQPYGTEHNAANYIGVVYSFNNSKFRIDTLWGETTKFYFYWKAIGY